MAKPSISSLLWSFETHWQSVEQKNRMYNPTASPSSAAPSSSQCVLVMDPSLVSHYTETQQV